MKTIITRAFLMCVLAAFLSVGAYAMEVAATEFSEVSLDNSAKVELSLQKASKEEIEGLDDRYFEAERGTLTYSDSFEGQRVALFMTAEEITDDDQLLSTEFLDFREVTSTGDSVSINFYPSKLSHNTVYYIYLSGSGTEGRDAFRTQVATMRYKDYYLGDLNLNREIDPEDSLFVLEMSAMMDESYEDWQEKAADVNRDGEIDPQDALYITQKAADPEMEFPSAA